MVFFFVDKRIVVRHTIFVMIVGRKIMKKTRYIYICPSPDAPTDVFIASNEKKM
jgi:hypothetical protein